MTKIKWGALVCFVLAAAMGIAAAVTALLPKKAAAEARPSGTGITYYIANDGSDENDGKSPESPFKSIGKLNTIVLEEGDSVLFKRGDKFYDETFEVQGNGTQENPITISAYGEGARPVIAARTTDKPCIYLKGNEGIEITDLELAESYQGISVEYDRDYGNRYLRFENLYIRDMLRSYNSSPAEYNHTSCGITIRANRDIGSEKTVALENLIVRNINFYNCEVGFWGCWKVGKEFVPSYDVGIIKNVLLENLYIERGNMWGFSFTFMENIVARNIVTRNTGLSPNNFGSCAVLFGFDKNLLIEGLDIDRHYRHSLQTFDGCGLDFEGACENVTVRDSVIRNIDGCGLFITLNTHQATYDFLMENCTIENFGLNDGSAGQGCAVLVFDNPGDPNYSTATIRNCTFINSRTEMTVPFYKNASPYVSFENCKTRYNTNWTYDFTGEGNTMTFDQYSNVKSIAAEGGYLKTEFEAGKNYIATPDTINLDTREGNILKIRMKNGSAAEKVKVQFIKDTDANYDDEKSIELDVRPNDTEVREYTLDLSECSAYRGFVRQLRFTFEGATSGGAEIDSVLILPETVSADESVLNEPAGEVPDFCVFGTQTLTENGDGSMSVSGTAAWRYGISSNSNIFLNSFSTKVKFDDTAKNSAVLSVIVTRFRHGWYTDPGNNSLSVNIIPQSSNMRVEIYDNNGTNIAESKTINGKPTETWVTVAVKLEDGKIKVSVNEAEFTFTDAEFDLEAFSQPMFLKYGLNSESQTATAGFTVADVNYGEAPEGYSENNYGHVTGLEELLDAAFAPHTLVAEKQNFTLSIVFASLAGAAMLAGIVLAAFKGRKRNEKD